MSSLGSQPTWRWGSLLRAAPTARTPLCPSARSEAAVIRNSEVTLTSFPSPSRWCLVSRTHRKRLPWGEDAGRFPRISEPCSWDNAQAGGYARGTPEERGQKHPSRPGQREHSLQLLVALWWDRAGAWTSCRLQTSSSFLGGYRFPVSASPLFHWLAANVRNEKHFNGTYRKTSGILRYTFKFLKAKRFGSLEMLLL